MKILRTDDARFGHLPDYAFAPHYVEIPSGEGEMLRVHYLDEGAPDAQTILCMHGEPSWCFLYRKMIPVFVKAGYRVLAPDLVGFGRSDKPTERSDYSYARHVQWMSDWMDKLGAEGLTLIGQDWGGLIGLRLLAARPERFTRAVVANTGLPTGGGQASEAFLQWVEFSQNVPEFPTGDIVKMGTVAGFSDDVKAAYDAPFPDENYKAGARAFPPLVPIADGQAGVEENKKAWKVLQKFEKPFLTAFSDGDPVTKGGEVPFREQVPGAKGQPHTTIKDAGHFLQEDKGEALAKLIVDFMKRG